MLGQAPRRREPRRPEERLHLEGVGHDDAEERPMPVHPPDGPRRALRDGGGGARHREQKQRDAEEWTPARARHDGWALVFGLGWKYEQEAVDYW